MMKGIAIPIALLTALPLFPASMSSLSTEPGYFDSSACPAPRIADADGTIEVFANGEWFSETEGELFVDGVKVSDIAPDAVSKIVLSGAADGTYRTYLVEFRGPAGEERRYITVFPAETFNLAMHGISQDGVMLDARPAGTVRKIDYAQAVPVAWSSLWSVGADRSDVKVYRGESAAGDPLFTFVEAPAGAEGVSRLRAKSSGMRPGAYTLVHFDGSETLTAHFNVHGGPTVLVIR
jgi:hypothetical protein